MTVRVASVSDAQDVARLTAQLGYDVEPSLAKVRLSNILARPDQRFLIAESNHSTVGWLHAAIGEYVETDSFVLIGGLVVDRSQRRQGIGRLLMEHAEKWAKEKGCVVVRLSSSAGRTEAHEFYKQLGYSNIKTQYAFAKSLDRGGRESLNSLVPRIQE